MYGPRCTQVHSVRQTASVYSCTTAIVPSPIRAAVALQSDKANLRTVNHSSEHMDSGIFNRGSHLHQKKRFTTIDLRFTSIAWKIRRIGLASSHFPTHCLQEAEVSLIACRMRDAIGGGWVRSPVHTSHRTQRCPLVSTPWSIPIRNW